jgi:hypothetical protein
METPDSMKSELAAWNNGGGIDIESWIGHMGNFSLAVGYASVFWPEFVLFDGYILREGFSEESLKGFAQRPGATRESVEWVMNHLHLADIHSVGSEDATKDKILLLGNLLKEIYETKLAQKWPDRPCSVEFHIPDDEEDFMEYQLSFWQKSNEAGG